jgi:membrane-associated phospholipid phosphatase
VIPLGALVVWMAGPERALDRFWTVVLVSGFACYGALPWIQTRPPRIVERSSFTMAERGSSLRRLNLAILERGSVGVNTLPSGHAATAVATALAVVSCTQAVGAVFVAAAALIAVATIVGRYHYAVDTVLGVLVGVAAWAMFPAS